jgi:short-subunit dehydrogenase
MNGEKSADGFCDEEVGLEMSDRKWILVTGATSGIGLATALLLAKEGYEVIATGRSLEKLAVVQRAADRAGVTIRQVMADVSDESSVRKLRDEVLALTNGYGIDVLVNNAGYAEGGAIEEIPLDRLRKQFETNVIGLVAVTQAFLPEMRKRKQGRIINISSVVGKVSIPLMGAYTASKFAVEALSDALRMELAGTGIDVVIVAPGSIQTNFSNTLIESIRSWVSPDSPYRDAYANFANDRGRPDRGAKPLVIAKAISTAIRSKKPKARYAVPADSKLLPVVKGTLPTRTLDKIIRSSVMGK